MPPPATTTASASCNNNASSSSSFHGLCRTTIASSSLSAEYQALQSLYAAITSTANEPLTYTSPPPTTNSNFFQKPNNLSHNNNLSGHQPNDLCHNNNHLWNNPPDSWSKSSNLCNHPNRACTRIPKPCHDRTRTMFRAHQIPYPTHKSPLEGDTAHRDLDWALASQTDPSFVHPIGHAGITKLSKLALLQNHFWPALAHWVVDQRSEVLPGGTLVGGWWRADIVGMMDWYRDCFGMTARWEDANVAHADGVWRDVLATSPWRDWPEFFPLIKEPVRDKHGNVIVDDQGRWLYRDKDPRTDGMEDAFVDLWEAVANSRPLKATMVKQPQKTMTQTTQIKA